MAARNRTPVAAPAQVEPENVQENKTPNFVDFMSLVSGEGKDAKRAVGNATGDAIFDAFREAGAQADKASDTITDAQIAVLSSARAAYQSTAEMVALDDNMILSSLAAGEVKPRASKPEDKAFKLKLERTAGFVDAYIVDGIMSGWLDRRAKGDVMFRAYARGDNDLDKANDEDKAKYRGAKDQFKARKSDTRKIAFLYPVLGALEDCARQSPTDFKYGGLAGVKALATLIREEIAFQVRANVKPVDKADIEEMVRTLAATPSEKKEKTAKTDQDKVDEAFSKATAAVKSMGKVMADLAKTNPKLITDAAKALWQGMRGQLGDVEKFPWDLVAQPAGELRPVVDGTDDKAAQEQAAKDAEEGEDGGLTG